MVGFELKALIILLFIISSFYNFFTYEEVFRNRKKLFGFIKIGGFAPSNKFWLLFFTSMILFFYAVYLNDQPPIILF